MQEQKEIGRNTEHARTKRNWKKYRAQYLYIAQIIVGQYTIWQSYFIA